MVIDVRSVLKPDAAALYTELHNNKIDLCFVSETWLNSKVASGLICPDCYLSYCKERSLRFVNRWGVAIICRNDWKIKRLDLRNDFECLWYEIITANSKYHVAVV